DAPAREREQAGAARQPAVDHEREIELALHLDLLLDEHRRRRRQARRAGEELRRRPLDLGGGLGETDPAALAATALEQLRLHDRRRLDLLGRRPERSARDVDAGCGQHRFGLVLVEPHLGRPIACVARKRLIATCGSPEPNAVRCASLAYASNSLSRSFASRQSSRLLSACVVALFAASSAAVACASSRSRAAGTTRLTRPQASASCASIIRPVRTRSATRPRPISWYSDQLPVMQGIASSTSGIPKRAVSEATRRSQTAASWNAAPTAYPFTAATVGVAS